MEPLHALVGDVVPVDKQTAKLSVHLHSPPRTAFQLPAIVRAAFRHIPKDVINES